MYIIAGNQLPPNCGPGGLRGLADGKLQGDPAWNHVAARTGANAPPGQPELSQPAAPMHGRAARLRRTASARAPLPGGLPTALPRGSGHAGNRHRQSADTAVRYGAVADERRRLRFLREP